MNASYRILILTRAAPTALAVLRKLDQRVPKPLTLPVAALLSPAPASTKGA